MEASHASNGYKKLVTAKTGSCDQLIYVNVKSGCRQSRNFKDLQSFCKWGVCGREMGGGVGAELALTRCVDRRLSHLHAPLVYILHP